MGFKEDADFARFVSMGAVGAAAVAHHLSTEHDHRMIELERYAMANKVWQTKVNRQEFERAAARVEDLLNTTDNLTAALTGGSDATSDLLADPELRTVLRYLAGPPISEDDLKTLADATSLAPSRLSDDDATVERIMQVLHASLDIKRFPWMFAHHGWKRRTTPMT